MVTIYNYEFISIWNKHTPIVTRRVCKRHTPWLNEDVINMTHQRDISHNFLRELSDKNYLAHKIARIAVSVAAQHAKGIFITIALADNCHFCRHIKKCTIG